MYDLHTHVLPGLDDGAKTMSEALEMARIAAGDGSAVLLATHPIALTWYPSPTRR